MNTDKGLAGAQWYLITVACLLVLIIACTAVPVTEWQSGWVKYSEDNFKSVFLPERIRFEIWVGYVRGAVLEFTVLHIKIAAHAATYSTSPLSQHALYTVQATLLVCAIASAEYADAAPLLQTG